MLDFGTSTQNANSIDFTDDRDEMDAMTSYSVAFSIRRQAAAANRDTIISKMVVGGAANGWGIEWTPGNKIRPVHNGIGATGNDTVPALNTTQSLIIVWDGSDVFYYLDNLADGSVAFSTAITGNALNISVGNDNNGADGNAASIGQLAFWPNYQLTELERALYFAGRTLPAKIRLAFWHRGVAVPGGDEAEPGDVASDGGTVTLRADDVDDYFVGVVSPLEVEIGSRLLRRRRFPEEKYSADVYPGFLNIEIGQEVNVSHDSLILPSSIIDSLVTDGPLVDSWKRAYARTTKISTRPGSGSLSMGFRSNEFYGCTFWSTDRINSMSPDEPEGLAQLTPGAAETFERGTVRYLSDADTSYMPVFVSNPAVNHVGYLAEDGTTNDLDNSALVDSLGSSWNIVEDTANNIQSGARALMHFRLGAVAPFYFSIKKKLAGDNYIWQNVATAAADGFRNVSVLYSRTDITATCHVACQRSDNSEWWNDATPGWQVSKVWNEFTTPGLTFWQTDFLEPLTIDWTGTLRIEVGMPSTAADAPGGLAVGNAQCTKGPYRFEHIPTDSAGRRSTPVGTQRQPSIEDTRKYVLDLSGGDPFRQVAIPDRGELRFKMTARQKASWMEDGDQFILFYLQYGTTTNNRDVVMYEKQSGENARLSVRRYTGAPSTQRARAFKEFDMVPGTVYECRWRWVSAPGGDPEQGDGELGLPGLTSSIFVDNVKGIDDASSEIPSNTDLHSELWPGCQPSSLGGLRAMNTISDWEILTRVHPDEQSLAYR